MRNFTFDKFTNLSIFISRLFYLKISRKKINYEHRIKMSIKAKNLMIEETIKCYFDHSFLYL